MEAKFNIGETLMIVDGPDKSEIGKEVTVIETFNFVRKSKVLESAVNIWEYKIKEGVKLLGWFPEYYLEPLNKTS